MRIIAGSRRGAILTKLDAVKTRPTADRVRESIFNILQAGRFQGLLADSQVIDVFAGTGALGLEAISRGAAFSSFIENDTAALAVLRANIAKLRFQSSAAVLAADATNLVHWRAAPANLVFADAPYQTGGDLLAINALAKIGALSDAAVVIIETAKTEILDNDALATGLTPIDQRNYGKALLNFLTYQTP